MSSIVRFVTTEVNRSGCQQANPGQAGGGQPQRPRQQSGRLGSAERNKRMRTTPIIGTPYSRLQPACACRRCRARRAKRAPRVVESTLVMVRQSTTTDRKKRSRWCLLSAGLLLLVLLLLTGMGMLWDSGPLAPLLFRPTATITLVPTRVDRKATLVITAVTGMPYAAQHEVAARFLSATSPVLVASGQATGTAHVLATPAHGTLTLYNAATYTQTIAAGTVLTGADGVQVVTDAPASIPAGNPPLFGVTSVSAHATLAGSRGNIAALDIDGLCCAAGVAVKNTAGFSGGEDAQTYPTVRQVDIDGLARPLVDVLTQSTTFRVRSQLRSFEWMVTIPACSASIRADQAMGSRATQVTVMVAVTCQAEAFDQQAALRLAATSFTREAIVALGANYALVSRVMTTLVGVTVTARKRGTLALSIETEGVWVYRWTSKQLEALAKHIAGARKQGALAFLQSLAGVQAASILLSGHERTMLPANPSRITIIVAGEQPG